jgi:hypothetical protein
VNMPIKEDDEESLKQGQQNRTVQTAQAEEPKDKLNYWQKFQEGVNHIGGYIRAQPAGFMARTIGTGIGVAAGSIPGPVGTLAGIIGGAIIGYNSARATFGKKGLFATGAALLGALTGAAVGSVLGSVGLAGIPIGLYGAKQIINESYKQHAKVQEALEKQNSNREQQDQRERGNGKGKDLPERSAEQGRSSDLRTALSEIASLRNEVTALKAQLQGNNIKHDNTFPPAPVVSGPSVSNAAKHNAILPPPPIVSGPSVGDAGKGLPPAPMTSRSSSGTARRS